MKGDMPLRCYAYILLIGLTACSGVKQEKSSKKEATTEQPTEVSGGFGLTMQCSVLNREVEGATSSEIGCVVSNDDGTKYTGSMKNLKASITAKGQTSAIQATPIMTEASSSMSVGVNVPGLKPGDALSIAINGLFDEKPATLSSTLKGRFAVICDEDMNLYVQVNAPASNLACTREAPCAKISQAVALLPDVFNCKVNVYLAPSDDGQRTFREQINIQEKQTAPGSALNFIGTDKNFIGDTLDVDQPGYPTMRCRELNGEVEGDTSSEIGCVVSTKNGVLYDTGLMKDLKASITIKVKDDDKPTVIEALPILTDGSSLMSLLVNLPKLKPGDVLLSISITGFLDEKKATLSANLPPPRILLEPPADLAAKQDPLQQGGSHVQRAGINVTSFGNLSAVITFANIEINGKSEYTSLGSLFKPAFFELGMSIDTARVSLQNISVHNTSGPGIRITNSSAVAVVDSKVNNALRGISVENSSLYIRGFLTIDAKKILPTTPNESLLEKNPMTPEIGISASDSALRFQSGTEFKTEGVEISIKLVSSDALVSKTVWMQLKNNNYGIRVHNNSSFKWDGDLSSIGMSEPKISIKDCKISCIYADNSIFLLDDDAGSTKRKKLELTSTTTSTSLIMLVNSAELTLNRTQNTWCNAGLFAIVATDYAKFRYLRKDSNPEAFANCTSTTEHKFHNFGWIEPANGNSCPLGTFHKDNLCYAQFGFGYLGLDNAVPIYTSIGTDADISGW
jgi:hypothetical protein